MNEKPNYYAIIPAVVRYSNELKANEKLLYGEITALANKTGECWASNQYFAKLYNVTPQAVSKWISNLRKKGFIQTRYVYKGEDEKEIEKRIITIFPEVLTNDLGVSTNDLGGYKQKVKDNNTSMNNKIDIYSRVVNELNAICGTNYKSTTGKTKRLIDARLNEGFTEDDFHIVIAKKASTWKGTEMEKYLRPETLFGTKFEGYLNEKISSKNPFLDMLNERQAL